MINIIQTITTVTYHHCLVMVTNGHIHGIIMVYTTYQNGDEWGLVQMALFYPHESKNKTHPYFFLQMGCINHQGMGFIALWRFVGVVFSILFGGAASGACLILSCPYPIIAAFQARQVLVRPGTPVVYIQFSIPKNGIGWNLDENRWRNQWNPGIFVHNRWNPNIPCGMIPTSSGNSEKKAPSRINQLTLECLVRPHMYIYMYI